MYIENSLFDEVKYREINKTILNLVNPKFFNIDINFSLLIKHILSDKKNRGNNVCFIFLENIGSTKIVYMSIESIEDKLKEIISSIFRTVK